MSDELHDHFQNKDNCYKTIQTARKAFGSTLTTEEEYDMMEKGLGLMFLHCPEDLQDIVHATLSESTARRFYHEMRWMNEELDSVPAMG
jgi:hypothetical protein